jgi:RNA polymerase I-specific transcription initiation factor RRN3
MAALVGRLTKTDDGAVSAIGALVKLAPSCCSFLMPAVEFHFPFHSRSIEEHVVYIGNLLRVAETLPMWRYKILELIIGKALIIDVELQNDAEQLKELDLCKEMTTCGEDTEIEPQEPIPEHLLKRRKLRAVRSGTKKLDGVLELVFSHIDQSIRKGKDELDEKKSREMFNFMLTVFEKTILPTFKSRYTQFLIFYMTSLRPTLADQFLGLLFKPLVQFCQSLDHGRNSMPNPKLLLSVTYIGSFVARARFLSDELLQLAFEMLIDLSTRLRLKTTIGSPKILTVISLQHIMYIFCARYDRLIAQMGTQELEDLFDILFEDATVLQYCNADIVTRFIGLAGERLGLLHPEVAVEYEQSRTVRFVTKYEDLEVYFPFDPIALSKCKVFINDQVFQDSLSEDEEEAVETESGRPSL